MKRLLKDNRGSITLEFSICGILFFGVVLGMMVMGLWIYNNSQVNQAARLAAYNVAITNNPAEANNLALTYLNKTLIACTSKNIDSFVSQENGYGVAVADMYPLFPGFQKLINPKGTSTVNGMIHIRKEALSVRAQRFRPDND
ncbi:MAG: TadE/TadG family type IV pilus assembly protein [Desulfocucumaceae bacterium]